MKEFALHTNMLWKQHALEASQATPRIAIPNGSLNISYVLGIKWNYWHLISFCQINEELKKN